MKDHITFLSLKCITNKFAHHSNLAPTLYSNQGMWNSTCECKEFFLMLYILGHILNQNGIFPLVTVCTIDMLSQKAVLTHVIGDKSCTVFPRIVFAETILF